MAGEATVDIRTAARASGLSVKAVRRRVERGSLPAVVVGGRRRIPVAALLEAGLLVDQAGAGRPERPEARVEADASLRDRLDRQGDEIARLADEVAQLTAEIRRLGDAAR